MIRLVPILAPAACRPAPLPVPLRGRSWALILCGVVASVASASQAATPQGAPSAAVLGTPVPMNSTDRYVQGKYDKTGTYIPPHYQPAAKPPFHGYFFKKDKAGIDINPNQKQNQKPD